MAEIIERVIDSDEDIDWIRFPGLVQDALLDGAQGLEELKRTGSARNCRVA